MNHTTGQINAAIFTHFDTRVISADTQDPVCPATIRTAASTGHEGHVMPMSPKPPAAKPTNEKQKAKAPPPVKPPAKKAGSLARTGRDSRAICHAAM